MQTDLAAHTPSRDERTLATVAHALSFVEGGILGPLLLYFLRKEAHTLVASKETAEDSAFVAFHSLQSTYFGVLFAVVALPVVLVTCGWGLAVLAPIYVVFELIACVKANAGEWYPLPVVGAWALRSHPRERPGGLPVAAAGATPGPSGRSGPSGPDAAVPAGAGAPLAAPTPDEESTKV